MGAMAVGTFGSGCPASEQRGTAMIGLNIGFVFRLMAIPTFRGDNRPESRALRPFNGMRGMAIDTDRQPFFGLGHQRAMHRFFKLHDNTSVTLAAGINYIFTINTGKGVILAPNVMGSMTVAAHGSYQQTIHEQSAAVNGHGIVFNNIMLTQLIPFSLGHLRSFTMTTAAGIGDIQLVNG